MKSLTLLVATVVSISVVVSLPAIEDDQLPNGRQARTFNDIVPFFKRLMSGFGFNNLLGISPHSNSNNDDRLGLNDLMMPIIIMKFLKDKMNSFGPQAGFGRTMRVLKDDSTYSISELLDDVEGSWKDYAEHVNSTQVQSRTGRTFNLDSPWDYLKKHNKFNGKIQKKFRALLDGPEADGLAVGGGIAAGIIGSVGLGLLMSHIKLVKTTEVIKGRSAGIIDDWAIENEIEDSVPLFGTVETAIESFQTGERSSRTMKDKLETIALKFKEFFTENKIMKKFEKLYRSKAVTPSAILGGIGAGLIGSAGLGLLASGLTDKARAGRGRALETNNDFDVAFSGLDSLVGGFVTELAETAEKAQVETQGRQSKSFDESRTLIHKLKFAYLLKKLIQSKKNGEVKKKLERFFKGQSPLAVTGGVTAAAIGATGLGLLIAALVKGDKNFFEADYDDVPAEYDPIYSSASSFGAPEYYRQDTSITAKTTANIPYTTTPATINEAQVAQLSQALVMISTGSCGQAQLCRELSSDTKKQILIANLSAAYDDQLGAYRSSLQGVLAAARRRECSKYSC